MHAIQIIAQNAQRGEREVGAWYIRRIPGRIERTAQVAKVRTRKRTKAAFGVLMAVDPGDVCVTFCFCGSREEDAQEVEGGDCEEGKEHAI